jgi:hypothetical protein
LFPITCLYQILEEFNKYQWNMSKFPESEDLEEYHNVLIRYSDTVKNFGDMVGVLHKYNSQKHSNYSPSYGNLIQEKESI